MYCSHFGFHRLPFNSTPDPTFYYSTPDHEEALATLQYAVQQRKGFVLVTGEVGAGKTLIGRMFLRQIEAEATTAVITHTHLSGRQLLAAICTELNLEVPADASNLQLTQRLQDYLLDQFARDRYVTVLLDEAQSLPDESFEELRMLGNLEADDAKLLQVCFLGQPELRDRFRRPEMKQLDQRLFRRFHLSSLTKQQTGEYVHHRLEVAGASRQIFTAGAVDRIFLASKGIPRLINQICDNALLTAYGQDADMVDQRMVDQVIEQDSSTGGDRAQEEVERLSGKAAGDAASPSGETDQRIEQVHGAEAAVTHTVAVQPSSDAPESEPADARVLHETHELQEQIEPGSPSTGSRREDFQRIARGQKQLERFVSKASNRWLKARDKLEAYRTEIQDLVKEVNSRCDLISRRFEELSQKSAQTEDLEEIRRMHVHETHRVLGEIGKLRVEFSGLLEQAESRWSEVKKRITGPASATAASDVLAELETRYEPRMQNLLDRLDQQRERMTGLIDAVRQQCDQTQDSLEVLGQSYARAHVELAEQMDAELADTRRELQEQLGEAARTKDLDALRESYDHARVEMAEHVDAELADACREINERLDAEVADTRREFQERLSEAARAEDLAALQDEHSAVVDLLADRLTEREKEIHSLSEQVAEQAAARTEIEHLRQAQEAQAADILGRIEMNREAMQDLVDSLVERCRSTQQQLDTVVSSHVGKEEFAQFCTRQKENISNVVGALAGQREEMNEQFEQIVSRWRQTQERIDALSATAADAGVIENLRQHQARDTEHILTTITSQRQHLETLVDGVDRRCEEMIAQLNALPDDIATGEHLDEIRAEHAQQIQAISSEIASRKALFEQAIAALEQRGNQTQAALDELAARAASIEDVEGLRQQHAQNVSGILGRIERQRDEQQQKVADLRRRCEELARSIDALAATSTPAATFKKVGKSLVQSVASLDQRIDEVTGRQDENLRTLADVIQQTSDRVRTLETMEPPKPIEIQLTPKVVTELGELVCAARNQSQKLQEGINAAAEGISYLQEESSRIKQTLGNWHDSSHAVQKQSDELRASARTAAQIIQAMQRFNTALNAKLNSQQRWQRQLARAESLANRLEQATRSARGAVQQLNTALADAEYCRDYAEEWAQNRSEARQLADRLSKLLAHAHATFERFDHKLDERKRLLTTIARNTAGLAGVIKSARLKDEERGSHPPARATGGEAGQPGVAPVDWPRFRTHQIQAG